MIAAFLFFTSFRQSPRCLHHTLPLYIVQLSKQLYRAPHYPQSPSNSATALSNRAVHYICHGMQGGSGVHTLTWYKLVMLLFAREYLLLFTTNIFSFFFVSPSPYSDTNKQWLQNLEFAAECLTCKHITSMTTQQKAFTAHRILSSSELWEHLPPCICAVRNTILVEKEYKTNTHVAATATLSYSPRHVQPHRRRAATNQHSLAQSNRFNCFPFLIKFILRGWGCLEGGEKKERTKENIQIFIKHHSLFTCVEHPCIRSLHPALRTKPFIEDS